MKRSVLLCLLLMVGVAFLSCKSDLSKGVDSYNEGDYDKAIEHLRKVRYDEDDYEKANKLILVIISIPKVSTEKATKRTFPINVWANGELNCSNDYNFEGYISSKDCANISVGDTCVIDVSAFPKEEFVGIVTDIFDKRYSTYLKDSIWDITVYISPDSYKHMIPEDQPSYKPLKSYMSAHAEFITGYLQDILCVPWHAVVHSRYSDEIKYVFIYRNEMVFQRSVVLGDLLTNGGVYIQIVDGLIEGEEIVDRSYLSRPSDLSSGQIVIKVDKEDLYEQ
ncbi:MAG: hypothetical protein K8R63_05785 [Bacteroidales bacterium]|nr:hypothetical protein [Bacteroidales bacterium]